MFGIFFIFEVGLRNSDMNYTNRNMICWNFGNRNQMNRLTFLLKYLSKQRLGQKMSHMCVSSIIEKFYYPNIETHLIANSWCLLCLTSLSFWTSDSSKRKNLFDLLWFLLCAPLNILSDKKFLIWDHVCLLYQNGDLTHIATNNFQNAFPKSSS